MRCLVLMGSPRRRGNTNSLVVPFVSELERLGHWAEVIWLYEREIGGCIACRSCQKDWNGFGCALEDDVQAIFDEVLASDMIILATPIYSWSCPAPMKAVLDRLVYGMNKYYGVEKGPALWGGKQVAIITSCGYRPEHGADLFEESIRRYCKHSQLTYKGMLAERDLGYSQKFESDDKFERAKEFARILTAT